MDILFRFYPSAHIKSNSFIIEPFKHWFKRKTKRKKERKNEWFCQHIFLLQQFGMSDHFCWCCCCCCGFVIIHYCVIKDVRMHSVQLTRRCFCWIGNWPENDTCSVCLCYADYVCACVLKSQITNLQFAICNWNHFQPPETKAEKKSELKRRINKSAIFIIKCK